jgi:hypothetical protein
MKDSQFVHTFVYIKQTTIEKKKQSYKNKLVVKLRRNPKQHSLIHLGNFHISFMILSPPPSTKIKGIE